MFTDDFGGTEEVKSMINRDEDKEQLSSQTEKEFNGSIFAKLANSAVQIANPLREISFTVDASQCRPEGIHPDETNNAKLIIMGLAIFGSIIFEVTATFYSNLSPLMWLVFGLT
ncbi:unnamed protein product [Protopolystoma xenopodis]|uniref:Uncharacterized protein n=1 Tax=Protopolystoma xenopodis TaxID=117903 RepID=A0A448XP57_9PLAT|nr:unnamed protein product [Protopolystoma xenopodis]